MSRSPFASAASRHSSRTLAIVGGGALLLAAGLFGGTLALAHGGPPAAGVIHTCVNNSSGTFKVVAADATCKNNETALDWNAQGIPGANGTNGVDGQDGAPGADGVSGWVKATAQEGPKDLTAIEAIGLSIDCPVGKKVLGGGSTINNDYVLTLESFPLDDDTWFVRHQNMSGGPLAGVQLNGFAICAVVAP